MTRAPQPATGTGAWLRSDGLVLVAGLVAFAAFALTLPHTAFGPFPRWWFVHRELVHVFRWSCFGIAVLLLLLARRQAPIRAGLIILVAAGCQIPALMSAPMNSSDAYRYVWDGRVQLAGISPYRYSPLDDQLAKLRDPVLFPGLSPDQRSGIGTPERVPTDPAEVSAFAQPDSRTMINRPKVPTIYPPVAQAWFTGIAAVTPWRWGTAGLQWGAALLAIGLTCLLTLVLRRRTGDPLLAVLWGWSPLVVLETGNNAHIDIIAAVLIIGAMLILRRPGLPARLAPRLGAGVLIGLAIATKILPLVILPAVTVLRRARGGGGRGLQLPFAAAGTALLTYVPHMLVIGIAVLGDLPGYLSEEGYSGGDRYQLLSVFVPAPIRQFVALGVLAALALAALWFAGQRRPEHVTLWLYGGVLFVTTPAYPWYCLPIFALAVLARRPEWVALGLATQWQYMHIHQPGPVSWAYVVAVLVIAGTGILRVWFRRRALMAAEPGSVPAREPTPA